MGKHFTLAVAAIIAILLCEVVAFSQSEESTDEKIRRNNEIISRTFKAGNEALRAKNYDEAIKQYDEGIAVDPEHPGTPLLLTNKSVGLKLRGVHRFNEAIVSTSAEGKASGLKAAKVDFRAAVEAATAAVRMLNAKAPPSDAAGKGMDDSNKYYALRARAEAMGLFVAKVDPTQTDAGLRAYQEYMEVATAPDEKAKAQLNLAKMLLDAGALDQAFAEYQKILAANPDNADALFGAGFALFAPGDKTKIKEAINYLQRFLTVAPATHSLRADVRAMLATLKQMEKPAP